MTKHHGRQYRSSLLDQVRRYRATPIAAGLGVLKLNPTRFEIAVEICDFHDDLRRRVIVCSH
jgi:hypothetical protein